MHMSSCSLAHAVRNQHIWYVTPRQKILLCRLSRSTLVQNQACEATAAIAQATRRRDSALVRVHLQPPTDHGSFSVPRSANLSIHVCELLESLYIGQLARREHWGSGSEVPCHKAWCPWPATFCGQFTGTGLPSYNPRHAHLLHELSP